MFVCSVPGCGRDAAYELRCGDRRGEEALIVHTCVFDRAGLEEFLSDRFNHVTRHEPVDRTPAEAV